MPIEHGAAKVIYSEVDNTYLYNGNYPLCVGIVLDTPRGDMKKATLIENQNQFLKRFMLNNAIAVNSDIGVFSALTYLEKGTKLYVCRATSSNISYGGALTGELVTLQTQMSSKGKNNSTRDASADTSSTNTGNSVKTHAPLDVGISDPENFDFTGHTSEILFYANDAGDCGKYVGYKISNHATDMSLKVLHIYMKGTLVAQHTFCRDETRIDGYGRSLYIENVLENSIYLKAKDNLSVPHTVLPDNTNGIVYLGGGSDGDGVTDNDRIQALQLFRNKDQYPITFLMDGGNSTINYASALADVASSRKDCFAILTLPYSTALQADSLMAAVAYRNNSGVDTSYAGFYYPHVKVRDRFNDRFVWCAPDGHIASNLVSVPGGKYWTPIAGEKPIARIKALDIQTYCDSDTLDILVDAQINPIRKIENNFYLWGNQTAQKDRTRTSKVHVRLGLIEGLKRINRNLNGRLFDFDDDERLNSVYLLVTQILKSCIAQDVYENAECICDKTNNDDDDYANDRVNIDLTIKAKGVMEKIYVNATITNDSASFNSVN